MMAISGRKESFPQHVSLSAMLAQLEAEKEKEVGVSPWSSSNSSSLEEENGHIYDKRVEISSSSLKLETYRRAFISVLEYYEATYLDARAVDGGYV